MLSAFYECGNKLVLLTPYVSFIIEDKWRHFYAFTLIVTFLYCLLLCSLSGILFLNAHSYICTLAFLAINGFFILYECAQMLFSDASYFADFWNWLDAIRGGMSVFLGVVLLYGSNPVKGTEEIKYLTLMVVMRCYLRGFTYFRSFRMTRIFVYMTLEVVKDMYSFLIILWYSVFAFGMFSAILLEFDSLSQAWTNGYNLLMGNTDNSTYGTVEWAVFVCATMTNIVIMLNLLVSILGEAYEKTQMSVHENDLHQQLNLILEYESMMFWRRTDASRGTVIVTCREGEDCGPADEWQGQILQITNTVKSAVESSFAKVQDRVAGIEETVAGIGRIEEKAAGISNIEKKVIGIEGKVCGMEEKIAQVEGKLQAIIELLSSKGLIIAL